MGADVSTSREPCAPQGIDAAYEALLREGDGPLVSVIIPLPDSRGHALESLRAWAENQSFPRERYEVILMGDGTEPGLEAQARARLCKPDRLIIQPDASEFELYDIGARAATGRWVVFTEGHCLGGRHCLRELVRHFATTGDAVAACRSVGFTSNHMARMESRAFDGVAPIRLHPDHWSKVFLRGSAVSREVYLAVGGINGRYHLFCEPDLSARIHATGHALGYAPRAIVYHYNTTRFRELSESVHGYIGGEIRYRLEHPAGDGDRYFGVPSWWQQRGLLDPAVDRNVWQSLGKTLSGPDEGRADRFRRWAMLLPFALLGQRGRCLREERRVLLARARVWWWRKNDDALFPAYRDLAERLAWQHAVHVLSASDHLESPESAEARDVYDVPDLPETWLTGFHLVEELDGEQFRWSGPVACLKLPLDPEYRVLRLRTRGLRPRPGLRAFLNGRRLAIHDCQSESGEIRLILGRRHFKPGPFQYLVLICEPLRPWLQGVPDQRELGLPLFSVVREGVRSPYSPASSPRAERRSSTKRRTSPATSSARSESAASYASAGAPPGSVVG